MGRTAGRRKDFKIGCFHGTVNPDPSMEEAKIRNDLYLIGMLEIEWKKDKSTLIRLVAKEMPLQAGKNRGECIDLFGYDQDHSPWIIELKKSGTSENKEKIEDQLHWYKLQFTRIQHYIEKEIRSNYHWKDFKFSGEPKLLALVEQEFYSKKDRNHWMNSGDITFCSFSRLRLTVKEGKSLLERFGSNGMITLKVINK